MSEFRLSHRRRALCAAAALAALLAVAPAWAEDNPAPAAVPPLPSAQAVDGNALTLGNPLNKPVTGAAEVPAVTGGEVPQGNRIWNVVDNWVPACPGAADWIVPLGV